MQNALALTVCVYGSTEFPRRSFGEFLAAEDIYRFVLDGMDRGISEEERFEAADYLSSEHAITVEVRRLFAYRASSGPIDAKDVAKFLVDRTINAAIDNGVISTFADEANASPLGKIERVVANS